jgi:hypothetical protein
MKITHANDGEETSTAIRGGAREFKTLLMGEDGSPDNYRAVLSRQSGPVDIPRHRHNFDQLRFNLEGDGQNYGPDRWIHPGELAYFPEGTPYGPEVSSSNRFGITFQFGGASGSGFLGSSHTKTAMEEMKAFGVFEKGIFKRTGELAEGERRNQDAFEAIWEYVNKRKLEYPKPRYDDPILIRPANFTWHAQAGQPGYSIKRLGTFSERSTELSMLRVEAGKSGKIAARPGLQVVFIVSGAGTIDGHELRKHSGCEIAIGESPILKAGDSPIEALMLGLPIFAEQRMAAE